MCQVLIESACKVLILWVGIIFISYKTMVAWEIKLTFLVTFTLLKKVFLLLPECIIRVLTYRPVATCLIWIVVSKHDKSLLNIDYIVQSKHIRTVAELPWRLSMNIKNGDQAEIIVVYVFPHWYKSLPVRKRTIHHHRYIVKINTLINTKLNAYQWGSGRYIIMIYCQN